MNGVDFCNHARRAFFSRLRRHLPPVARDLEPLDSRLREAILRRQVMEMFGMHGDEFQREIRHYRKMHETEDYERRFGEKKTLCFEEAFIIYMLMKRLRPVRIVEIGTQYGKSTRKILDASRELELRSQVSCFDILDEVQFFAPDEATLVLSDLTGRFEEVVMTGIRPDFIFLDARPYHLLKEVIGSVLMRHPGCTLAIHDCAPELCRREMNISKDDAEVTSETGIWERHVLAELFHYANPLAIGLSDVEVRGRRMRIFSTQHGLAVLTATAWQAARKGSRQ